MAKTADLYRMVLDDHLCPYGLKAKHLLERQGYDVNDHVLVTRPEVDTFKDKHNVETTPQTWIAGKRIGGYDDLRAYFDQAASDENNTTYRPVIAIFAVAALLACAISWAMTGALWSVRTLEWFGGSAMVLLALQKLKDVEGFSIDFLRYDLLAQRWAPYSTLYPYAEVGAGLLMIAGALPWVSGPLALFVGTIGAISVFKAVYIDQRELTCACVGSDSNVPLGFISLTENILMIIMGFWMLTKI